MRPALGIVVGATLLACGRPNPPTPTGFPAPPPQPTATAVTEPDPPARPHRRPFEVHNSCAEVVTIVFGDDPQTTELKRTIVQGASVDAPRDDEGNQTVWLLGESGAPLLKVHVTRGMKRVEVGRSCRTLDAR